MTKPGAKAPSRNYSNYNYLYAAFAVLAMVAAVGYGSYYKGAYDASYAYQYKPTNNTATPVAYYGQPPAYQPVTYVPVTYTNTPAAPPAPEKPAEGTYAASYQPAEAKYYPVTYVYHHNPASK